MTYGSDLWKWSLGEQSEIGAVELTDLRTATWVGDRVMNEGEREGLGIDREGTWGEVWSGWSDKKQSALRRNDHVRRMCEEKQAKQVYFCDMNGISCRPPDMWKGKIEQYSSYLDEG